MKNTFNGLRTKFVEYWLEILLFGIALGNASVLEQYLIKTGATADWQLTVAIYSTEVLIASVSIWGVPGLALALVMFCTSLWAINAQFGDQAIGHAYFSISLFAGSVANYVRRYERSSKLTKAFAKTATAPAQAGVQFAFNSKGQLDPAPFLGMGARQLRETFQLSHNKAKEMREALARGETVTKQWLDQNRQVQQPAAPAPAKP